MIKSGNYLVLFISILIFSSCWGMSRWTKEELAEFTRKCKNTSVFEVDPISFSGFDFQEVETIVITEKFKNQVIDTNTIHVDQVWDGSFREKYWISPSMQMNINHTYEFHIGQGRPYILDSMEMIVWPQFSMFSEGYGCIMGNFKIDSVKFVGMGNINFIKRGFSYN